MTSDKPRASELVGKTIVHVHDPYPHGDGLVPPSAHLKEIAVVEDDYFGIRLLASLEHTIHPELRPIIRSYIDFDELEPGDRLERYLPEAMAVFGTPDFVVFSGSIREKWDREHATPTGG